MIELEVVPPLMRICCLDRPDTFEGVYRTITKLEQGGSTYGKNGHCVYCGKPLPSVKPDYSYEAYYYGCPYDHKKGKSAANIRKLFAKPNTKSYGAWQLPNKMSVYELLADFFQYFGAEFEYEKYVVSERLGGTKIPRNSLFLPKQAFAMPNFTNKVLEDAGQPTLLIEHSLTWVNMAMFPPHIILGYFKEFRKAHWYLTHGKRDQLLSNVWDKPASASDVWERYRQVKRYKAWLHSLRADSQRVSAQNTGADGHN
ncbi:hypothetical protein EV182_006256 [Spiromyces aspiralis]|uniref:Uncharacterized protein n=1 Tax=Spiromyces aspiralis TaxID=68401 RepID=A0ACC1HNZ8_9FUNG|nr:hypothetical protein EV182_006256 [Spiromyces aspiralis]